MKNIILIDSGLSNSFWAESIKIANYLQNKLLQKAKTMEK